MKRIFIILILLGISFAAVSSVQAAGASLYLSPASGTYAVGGSFSVAVKVNSGGTDINAAEGVLVFNSNQLNVVSISKTGSIFSLWTNEPTFSNSVGNIVWGGGTPSGFNGSSGTIMTVIFKANANASAQVNFSSGSVLAADGKGTNVLVSMTGGTYTIGPKITAPPAEEVSPEAEYIPPAMPTGAPATPIISSATHPDPDKWYSNNSPEFSWNLPSDITAVKLLIGHLPTVAPTVLYSPPIFSKKLDELSDGVWYFHVQFKNNYGWGGILHRKVLIDTETPQLFETKIDNGGDPTNPTPILHFKAIDYISGIEYYEVKIGEREDIIPVKIAKTVVSNPYEMPVQSPGKHTLIIKAVDAANNETLSALDIIIEPLEKPIIIEIPQSLEVGDVLEVKGTSSYSDARVTVFVKQQGEEPVQGDVNTDNEGNWIFIYEKTLEKGIYQVWAEITDSRGAKSKPTEEITISVSLTPFIKIGKIAIDYLSIMIILIALVILLILVILYGWRRITVLRKKIKKETKEAQKALEKAFGNLKEEVRTEVAKIDRRPGLSLREKKISDKLKKALRKSEETISKEIKDIRRELK